MSNEDFPVLQCSLSTFSLPVQPLLWVDLSSYPSLQTFQITRTSPRSFFFFFSLKMAVRLFLPKNITPKLSSQERNPALLKFCSSGKSLHPREEEHCLGNESSHISPGTSDGKAFACSVGDPGFNPWVGNIPWRREWQPNPVFLAGEFQGQRTLVDYIVSAITRVGHS